MIIHPEVQVTPDSPTIRFKADQSQVDLSVEIPRILGVQGWGLGTVFNVQFINHERTELISMCQYAVTIENEQLHTANPESNNPNTKAISSRAAKQISEWMYFNESGQTTSAEPEVKWNPGLKKFQVKVGDEVLFEDSDKAKAEEYRNAA